MLWSAVMLHGLRWPGLDIIGQQLMNAWNNGDILITLKACLIEQFVQLQNVQVMLHIYLLTVPLINMIDNVLQI